VLRRALPILAALTALAVVFVPSALANDSPGREGIGPFLGSYRFVDGARDRRSWEEGVERAVNSLNPMIRGFAASRIRDSVRPERRVAFEPADGDRVRVRFDDWTSPPLSPSGGQRQGTDWQGSSSRFSLDLRGDQLLFRSAAEPGTRESFFSLGPDNAYLFMQVRVSSDRLPESIRYTLTYRRQ